MRHLLCVLFCLAIGPIAAEKIGNVEYHLPNQGQGWKVAEEIKADKKVSSLTVVYIPTAETKEESKEFFVVHVNNLPTDPSNVQALEKGLEKVFQLRFPNATVKLNALEISPQAGLYEYSIQENGNEKVHGWIRAFANPDQTVLLTYQTDIVDKVNEVRPIWMQVLKEAKVVE